MMRHIIHKRPASHCSAYSSNVARLSAALTNPESRGGRTAINKSGSLRQFSTQMHTISSPSSYMLSPFLDVDMKERSINKNSNVDVALMGLLKAMSEIKSSPADEHVLDLVDEVHRETGSAVWVDVTSEEVNLHVTEPGTTAAAGLKTKQERTNLNVQKTSVSIQIQHAMNSKCVGDVVKIIEHSMDPSNEQLNDTMLDHAIHFLSNRDLHAAFKVLKYHVQRSRNKGKIVKLDVYRRIILGIHNTKIRGSELRDLVHDIHRHIRSTFSEGNTVIYQHILLPSLVAQLVQHKDNRVGMCAKPIVEYMLREEFPLLNPEMYEAILNECSINRVGRYFLPYHKLLTELVSRGYKPQAATVHNLLQSHYPYSDVEATCEILQAIKNLTTDSASSTPSVVSSSSEYSVDIGTLESISLATQRGHTELNLLIWDLVDLFGYKPTECMFEDVVLSFGAARADANSFKALIDMEDSGYVPSYVLLRHFAVKLSGDHKRISHAHNLLNWSSQDEYLSTSTLNCLLLGFGMRKDINMAFGVFEDFAMYGLETDKNTYSFLMESLYLSARDQFISSSSPEDMHDISAVIDTIIGSMELAGVERSGNFVYEHIRLLCMLTKIEDAKALLEDAIASRIPIKPGSIVMIATEFLNRGDVGTARHVANLSVAAGNGNAPDYLVQRIQGKNSISGAKCKF